MTAPTPAAVLSDEEIDQICLEQGSTPIPFVRNLIRTAITVAIAKAALAKSHAQADDAAGAPNRAAFLFDTFSPSRRMIVCEICGNKRCPHATDKELACTNSNEPGQVGSAYQNAPFGQAPAQPGGDERELFERWILSKGWARTFRLLDSGEYLDQFLNDRWEVWQATNRHSRTSQAPAQSQGAVVGEYRMPPFDCFSKDDGDSWFIESPADMDVITSLTKGKVGDEFELLSGWNAITAKFRIVKAEDEMSDDIEVECISHPEFWPWRFQSRALQDRPVQAEPVAWALYWGDGGLCRVTTDKRDADDWLKHALYDEDSIPGSHMVPLGKITTQGATVQPSEDREAS